jgi:hypothetical protein
METGLVDRSGYPIGQLYMAVRFEAKARGIDIFSDKFQNNRTLFLSVGVPEKRIRTVTPQLITTRFIPEHKGIPIDVLNGIDVPEILKE